MGMFDDIGYDPERQMFFERRNPSWLEDRYFNSLMQHEQDYRPPSSFTISAGPLHGKTYSSVKEFVDERLQMELNRELEIFTRIMIEKSLYGNTADMYGFFSSRERGKFAPESMRLGPLRIIYDPRVPPGEFWLRSADGKQIARHRFRDDFNAEEYNAALEDGAFDD